VLLESLLSQNDRRLFGRLHEPEQMTMYGSHQWTGWVDLLPEEHWSTYRGVLEAGLNSGVPFALGGALATATHTGQWRGTNDMDLYVQPSSREEIVAMFDRLGLRDIQSAYPYDPSVTYRASKGHVIVELIWGMKNHRAQVDAPWLSRAEEMEVRGMKLRITAPEEMIWPKLYVLCRERCDWPDVLNLLYFCGAGMDWEHLLRRLGPDAPLLSGVLCILNWLSPQSLRDFPAWLLPRLGWRHAGINTADEKQMQWRASLLKSQEWFGAPLIQAQR
jgi:hypothetical protein